MTSLARLDEFTVLVGCDSGDIFQMDVLTFESFLLSTCHTGLINDIAFPRYIYSELTNSISYTFDFIQRLHFHSLEECLIMLLQWKHIFPRSSTSSIINKKTGYMLCL